MATDYFHNKKVNIQKLLDFGFKKNENGYFYSANLADGQFKLTVSVTADKKIKTEVVEIATNEIYTLHLVEEASGAFVGKIKEEYAKALSQIVENCFEKDIFKSQFAKKIIEYVRNKYECELEYLWDKFPNNAVVRRKDNAKWYLAILTIAKNKLGFVTTEQIEVIDLREEPENIEKIVDNKKIFAGYHMNKKHWLTIMLDGSVSIAEINKGIDKSYALAKKTK